MQARRKKPWVLGAYALELVHRLGGVAHLAQRRPEARADVDERRAERQRALIFAHGVGVHPDGVIGGAGVGVHVRDLALREGIEAAGRALRGGESALVDLLGLAVLAEVVVRHGEVERGFGVGRVDLERAPEHSLGVAEASRLVIDDAQHVVDVGVGHVLAQDLGEAGLRLVVLARDIVIAPARHEIAQRVLVSLIVSLSHGRPQGRCSKARPVAREASGCRRSASR